VLAIDQAPKEKDGQNAVVGKTVTLELKPEQAETLARARQTGTLSLALRSIADVNMVENKPTTGSEARRKHQRGSLRRPKLDDDTEVTKGLRYEMQGKSAAMRTLAGPRPVVFGRRRADAQSGLTPVVASDYRAGAGCRRRPDECALSCARHRQIRRDRPAARHQGCAGRRSQDRQRRGPLAQRAYIIGAAVGQTNIVFFDAAGQQIAAYDIAVKRDLNGVRAALKQIAAECRTSRSKASATA
jgi:hypothetical protein